MENKSTSMPTYSITAINVGTFNLGESDRLLTLFSAERGLMKAVAKGARKPGSKMTGRSEILHANKLLLATGRSLDIITQAETLEAYQGLRSDLVKLAYGLYYAELTQVFGQGLSEESRHYFDYLCQSLRALCLTHSNPTWLCLQFEMGLLDMLGYKPELTRCVNCREALTDHTLESFHADWGGIICRSCLNAARTNCVAEMEGDYQVKASAGVRVSRHITPLVWKHLVLAAQQPGPQMPQMQSKPVGQRSLESARQLVQTYIEHRAGKKLKSLDFVSHLSGSHLQ